jgi:hypothetical protein
MKRTTLVALLAAVLALAGCVKEQDGEGRLRMQFSVNQAVTEYQTRALSLDAPELSEFSLVIESSDGTTYNNSWASLSDYPASGVYLKTGTYTATSSYGDPTEEGFDKPAFEASESFNISEGRTVIQSMEATLVNMAVTVSYTTAFEGYFPEHYAVITTSAGNNISFRNTDQPEQINADRTAYIYPADFTLTVYYTLQNGNTGQKVFNINNTTYLDSKNQLIAPVGARKWANITIDVNSGEVGDGTIEIVFDDSVTDESRYVEIGEE